MAKKKTAQGEDRFEGVVLEMLRLLGEDPGREGLLRTPERVAKSLKYLTQGYQVDPKKILEHAVFKEPYDEMVIVKDIEIFSLCEHHLLPFYGKAHIAYIPKDSMITGLSCLVRVVELFSRRLQVQERMTTEIADLLMDRLSPRGVLVQIEARHLCMDMRGVKKPGTLVKTEAVRGNFRRDERTRAEALSLLRDA
ncbi:MAG: GTP cyclohydrolase I FolE [Synergistales bacterium]|nr:GTP cyclohydrolase I FolE [Synergistales bacterium]